MRKFFKEHIPEAHIVSIESWTTEKGVPDMNVCLNGHQLWVENKLTYFWKPTVIPEQIAWTERHLRAGGIVYIAVRRIYKGSPTEAPDDQLYFLHGKDIRLLHENGLRGVPHLLFCSGGPTNWDWQGVKQILQEGNTFFSKKEAG
jgi:hypothetical protein